MSIVHIIEKAMSKCIAYEYPFVYWKEKVNIKKGEHELPRNGADIILNIEIPKNVKYEIPWAVTKQHSFFKKIFGSNYQIIMNYWFFIGPCIKVNKITDIIVWYGLLDPSIKRQIYERSNKFTELEKILPINLDLKIDKKYFVE